MQIVLIQIYQEFKLKSTMREPELKTQVTLN